MKNSVEKIKGLIADRKLEEALLLVKENRDTMHINKEVLHLEVEAYSGLQEFGKAINVLREILTLFPKDDVAKAKKEQIETILKYVNMDIYANPNLSHDPWE